VYRLLSTLVASFEFDVALGAPSFGGYSMGKKLNILLAIDFSGNDLLLEEAER
jgi:hypothetical protein